MREEEVTGSGDSGDDDSGSGETATDSESEESESEDDELQPWRHSIFGFCDNGIGHFCTLCWCSRCIYGAAISQTFHRGPSQVGFYICCCLFADQFSYCNRAKIRAKYGLEGHNLGACGDCLSVCICPWCERYQQILELETRQGMLYGPCSAVRGDPRRLRGSQVNTGGGMMRGNNKVAPMRAGTKDETRPLKGGDGAEEGEDEEQDSGLERSQSGRLVDTSAVAGVVSPKNTEV